MKEKREERPIVGYYKDFFYGERPVYQGDKVKIVSPERQKANLNYYELMKNKNELAWLINEHIGSFYFNNYMNLLKKINDDYATAFRFLYLCTYANYEGYIEFSCRKKTVNGEYNSERYATLDELGDIFNVSDSMGRKIKSELISKDLIMVTSDNRILVNSDYCTHSISKNKKNKDKYTRVFEEGIREIYHNILPREHKKVGLIIPLLQYTNTHLNILCKNINELEPKYMQPLGLGDICEILHYPVHHRAKLREALFTVKVKDKPLIGRFQKENKDIFVVNPSVFYKGSDPCELLSIINLFEVGDALNK